MRLITSLLLFFASATAHAADAQIAVAANFTAAARELGAAYRAKSGHEVGFSFGATGILFTQIGQGAPFDAFLSADQDRPARAEAEGLAVEGSRFTYARGRLALYCPAEACEPYARLRAGTFDRLAIANPGTAPYGAAAMQVIRTLKLDGELAPKLVRGSNVGQTFQFVASGNAEMGFVAVSQVKDAGPYWLVPASMHKAIKQDAALLLHGETNEAAKGFLQFLKSPEAQAIIRRFGYDAGEGTDG